MCVDEGGDGVDHCFELGVGFAGALELFKFAEEFLDEVATFVCFGVQNRPLRRGDRSPILPP